MTSETVAKMFFFNFLSNDMSEGGRGFPVSSFDIQGGPLPGALFRGGRFPKNVCSRLKYKYRKLRFNISRRIKVREGVGWALNKPVSAKSNDFFIIIYFFTELLTRKLRVPNSESPS